MYKYSVLCYIFNGYELLHEPDEIDPECHYICITDNRCLKSKCWDIKFDDTLTQLSAFDKCYRVRFNLFKYADTDICIYVDASIQIKKSLRKLYDDFVLNNYDLGVQIHPERDNLLDEYFIWMDQRNYPKDCAYKCINYMKNNGYDFNTKGIIQGTIRICKNTELNKQIDTKTFDTLIELGNDNIIERLDQTVYTYIVFKYFPNIKVMHLSQQLIQSDYMKKLLHGSNWEANTIKRLFKKQFYNNKLVEVYNI